MIIPAYAARIDGAAGHLVDGHAHDLAPYVPECLVDSRDRGSQHGAAAVKAADVHRLIEMLDLHGIAADNEVLQIHYAGHCGAGIAFKRGFAPTRYALIGFEFDENIGPVGLRDTLIERYSENAHVGDPQFRSHIVKRGAARRFIFSW